MGVKTLLNTIQYLFSLKHIAPAGSSRENNSGDIEPPLQIAEDVHLPETASEDPPDTGDVIAEPNNSDRITSNEDGQTKTFSKDTEHSVPLRRSTPSETSREIRRSSVFVVVFC